MHAAYPSMLLAFIAANLFVATGPDGVDEFYIHTSTAPPQSHQYCNPMGRTCLFDAGHTPKRFIHFITLDFFRGKTTI